MQVFREVSWPWKTANPLKSSYELSWSVRNQIALHIGMNLDDDNQSLLGDDQVGHHDIGVVVVTQEPNAENDQILKMQVMVGVNNMFIPYVADCKYNPDTDCIAIPKTFVLQTF